MKNRIDVINDTLQCIINEEYGDCMSDIGEHSLSPSIYKMIDGSEVWDKNIPLYLYSIKPTGITEPYTKVTVENKDTFEKASEPGWREECAVLNMASEYVPGGGVLNGSTAQEEELCRRSTLLRSLYMFSEKHKPLLQISKEEGVESYPFKTYSGIWSPYVEVFKDRNYDYLEDSFCTNVISMAALRRPKLNDKGELGKTLQDIMKDKIRALLRLAGAKRVKKLVLGAWGCGAFKNPPQSIAKLFKTVLEEDEFKGWFSDICFAIIDNPKNKDNNYDIFKNIIEE